ncbi:MAG: RluA family pseudouridine synthase [Clostridia bacterium]|nr:RluA family pseudouridine synthase [Clostridia bacterium]MBR2176731.1 RluA family pseudouridine synthase [Clostridia bacterium]
MRTVEIGANDAGQRLDKFLSKKFKNMPKALMYKYIRTKHIKLNGKKCDISAKLQAGDILTMYIKDEFFEPVKDDYDFLKAPVKLDIIYEDKNILLLNKKPGLIVHPDENYHFDSLIARVQHYLYDKGEYDPKDEQSFAPALVNRIDRNTGGIVIAAKTAEALRVLNQKLKDRELEKLYLCTAVGIFKKKEALLIDYLEKNEKQNRVYISNKPTPNSKTIKTKYRVLAEKDQFSLLEVDLLTGRTHQIRAHLAYIGHPLLGDGKYGKNEINRKMGYKWQALYSYKLIFKFTTPAGSLDYLNGMSFTAPDVWFTDFFSKTQN